MKPTGRQRLANLALLAAASVVGLLVCEGLVRVLGFGTERFEAVAGIPFKHRANIRFVNRKENPNRVVMNNWGFHDRRRDPETPGYRILVLGDSFVEGLQVAVEDLFTSRLELLLRRRDPEVEVVNAGLGGIGTAHEFLIWRDFFHERIRLDHVLLVFCNGNDLANNHPLLESAVNGNETENKAFVRPTGEVYVVPRGARRQRLADRVASVSVLARTVRRKLYLLRKSLRRKLAAAQAGTGTAGDPGPPPPAPELGEAWDQAIAGTLRLLDRWHGELRAAGVEFSVAIMPWADHGSDNPYGHPRKAAFAERLRELAAERGFDLLELRYGDREPVEIFSFDGVTLGHFNPRGHALVAELLGDWLANRVRTPS